MRSPENLRPFDQERDLASTVRIWREVGWLPDSKDDADSLAHYLSGSRTLVAEVDGSAECIVIASPGTFRYLHEDLKMAAVTGVVTGHTVRKRGLAKRLTSRLLAEETAAGAEIAVLSFFEQGYYDQLGFGNGPYEHLIQFDPAMLDVPDIFRSPSRIGNDDWAAVHQAMCSHQRVHGNCILHPAGWVRAEMIWCKNPVGLGYHDAENGALSHFVHGTNEDEAGPLKIRMMAWQNETQLLELLCLLRSLGDQLRSVHMLEPHRLQIQDFIKHPVRERMVTKRSPHEHRILAMAPWQARILNLPACIARTHLDTTRPVRFNLELTDPISSHLADHTSWTGCQDSWILTLGPESEIRSGTDRSLPTLHADIGAFTRLWNGSKGPHMLALQAGFSAPESLLDALAEAFAHMPTPYLHWSF